MAHDQPDGLCLCSVPGKRARRQLARPESEHVVREYLELAIIEQITWRRVQAKFERRKHGEGRGEIMRGNQRTYLLSGLLRCGVCGGPMSVSGQKLNKVVRYASFGCTAHASRGGAICSNKWTINEKKLTEAFLSAMKHEVLTIPHVLNELTSEMERRAAERAASGIDELEGKLRIAEARVKNATKLMIDMPDDQEIRKHREVDLKDARRLEAEIAAHAVATTSLLPTKAQATEAIRIILAAISDAAPDRAREVLSKALAPLLLTPKIEGPNHLVEVTGSLAPSFPGYESSGGRI